ncbi:MAG TPA: sigma 54-interacting transcriptional regulator [Spirochaetales bacterium]|nr:sigma 54-interacting transcriptional regulator [Spirochaetales bacterium]
MIQWTVSNRVVETRIDTGGSVETLPRPVPEGFYKTILDSISDGIIILDRDGYVLDINTAGASILKVDRDESRFRHVSEIVDFRPVILDVLESEQGYMEKEFIIHSPSRGRLHFIKSAIVIRNEEGELVGVIDTFRKVDSVHNMIARFTGAKAKFSFHDIIGKDPFFMEAVNLSRLAAGSSANVLLEGESGTGKEIFAHAIHNESLRSGGPFIIVNCASLPISLIESELFGYESGSFTGARKEGFAGKFEQANGGTLFLDEIGEMPLDMQAKLLRVIQDKTFTRIGGFKEITVDLRIIAATNKNLQEHVRNGNFREDLYYRLNVLRIRVPSLRQRPADIPLLARHFLRKYALRDGKPIPMLEEEAMQVLTAHSWPGNVRELENLVERLIVLNQGICINKKVLEPYVGGGKDSLPLEERPEFIENQGIRNLETIEKEEIRKALTLCNGNISVASRFLGISRNTLYRKMKQFSL